MSKVNLSAFRQSNQTKTVEATTAAATMQGV